MFNGIIYNLGIIKSKNISNNNCYIEVGIDKKFADINIGSSINCNGVCLTLIKKKKKSLFFYLSIESMNISNFKDIQKGDTINLEKSLKFGNRISGHYVQGHVDTTGVVKNISILGKSWFLDIAINKNFVKYLVYKGSISINGVSLTISKILNNSFQIVIIPHTLGLTNLVKLEKKDVVNIEIDIFSKYLFKLKN